MIRQKARPSRRFPAPSSPAGTTKLARRSLPCAAWDATRCLYVRKMRMGKRATKREENIPATILSQVTRMPDRQLAINRFSTAVRVDESVETVNEARSSTLDSKSDRGTTPILANM